MAQKLGKTWTNLGQITDLTWKNLDSTGRKPDLRTGNLHTRDTPDNGPTFRIVRETPGNVQVDPGISGKLRFRLGPHCLKANSSGSVRETSEFIRNRPGKSKFVRERLGKSKCVRNCTSQSQTALLEDKFIRNCPGNIQVRPEPSGNVQVRPGTSGKVQVRPELYRSKSILHCHSSQSDTFIRSYPGNIQVYLGTSGKVQVRLNPWGP